MAPRRHGQTPPQAPSVHAAATATDRPEANAKAIPAVAMTGGNVPEWAHRPLSSYSLSVGAAESWQPLRLSTPTTTTLRPRAIQIPNSMLLAWSLKTARRHLTFPRKLLRLRLPFMSSHTRSTEFTMPQTPTPPAAGVPQAAKAVASQKSESAGEGAAPEGRRRRPGYNRPYSPYQRPGYQRPGYQRPGYQRPGYQRPGYQRPGGYPSRYPYRPYLREYLVDPEFEPYDPVYERSSSLGHVLDAFVRVITRISSVGKSSKPSKKGSPTTNGTTSTGPGTDVTSTGPPSVDNGEESNLTSTPPQSPPAESIFYSIDDVTGPFKFLVALA
ncbi:hypothetical protein MTO96_020804 [Rhipicephalus appendiculatus]